VIGPDELTKVIANFELIAQSCDDRAEGTDTLICLALVLAKRFPDGATAFNALGVIGAAFGELATDLGLKPADVVEGVRLMLAKLSTRGTDQRANAAALAALDLARRGAPS